MLLAAISAPSIRITEPLLTHCDGLRINIVTMAPRPTVVPGEHWISNSPPATHPWSRSRCKGYDAPPHVGGRYLYTLPPDSLIGPIEVVVTSETFVSVLVDGAYINLWSRSSNSVLLARRATDSEVRDRTRAVRARRA